VRSPATDDEEDDDDDNDNDTPPAVKKAFLPQDYDEDAAFARSLEESKAKEDAKWSWEAGLDDGIRISTLMVEHHASLPPPQAVPRMPHAPPQATWQGQMVPRPLPP
jgi:hypothetical protein